MTNMKLKLAKVLIGMMAVFALAAPATSHAAGIAFTNKLDTPVLVQGISNVNGMLVRSQPILIAPGKTVYDPNVFHGARQIIIYDANQPKQPLMKKFINFPGFDIHYDIMRVIGPTGHPVIDLVIPKK
jgi:hypothetical protein